MAILRSALEHLREVDKDFDPCDEPVLMKLVFVFNTVTKVRIHKMCLAIANQQYKVAGQQAHLVKASAVNLGAITLAEICQDIEDAANSNAQVNWKELSDMASAAYMDAKEEIPKVIDTL